MTQLTAKDIDNAKPKTKLYRLYDQWGLFMEIVPTAKKDGGKRWRFKYRRPNGTDNNISLGTYPEITLKDAREQRDEMRRLVANGTDPAANRKAIKQSIVAKASNSFEVVGREWHNKNAHQWTESHRNKILRALERDVFPWLGKKPVADIIASDFIPILDRVDKRGATDTAHRILTNCSRIFRYAISSCRAKYNPCPDLKGYLARTEKGHFKAITEPDRVGELLRAINGYRGTLAVQCALKLAPFVFVRPVELRTMEWKKINFETAEWRFISSKKKKELIVPLSRQAVEILREIQPLTGTGRFVFPNMRSTDRPMSDNAILSALRRLEIPREEMCGHGFRAMARTILAEHLKVPREIIMLQLTHKVSDPLGEAYDRTTYLPERTKMMQVWADFLDELRNGKIVSIARVQNV